MRYVNLTPHAIIVMDENGAEILNVPPSGTVARIGESWATDMTEGHEVPIVEVLLTSVIGLPDAEDGVTCIGSMPLLMAMRAARIDRPDVMYPFGQVRDESGRIIGCRSLAIIVE